MRKTNVGTSKVLIFVFIMIFSEIHLMSSGQCLSFSSFFLSFLSSLKQKNKPNKLKKILIKSQDFRDC